MSKNNSGIVLIIVLWILAILSLLALSLSKRSSTDVLLMRNSIGKLRAYAAARAGINYVESLLTNNKTDKDTLYQLGIKYSENQTSQTVFKNIKIDKNTHFDVFFSGSKYGVSPDNPMIYELEDEQSKINLNAIDNNNYKIFSKLLEQFSISSKDADDIAFAVIDWHSSNATSVRSVEGSVGNKDEYYLNQPVPYKCKNGPFDSIEELLLVKGMTKELFMKIKDFITIFPKLSLDGLKVNFRTAPDRVLRAFVNGQAAVTAEDEDFVEAMIHQRNGMDNVPFTSDDGASDQFSISAVQQMELNALSSSWGIDRSQYFRVHSVGTDDLMNIKSSITAVIFRPLDQGDLKIVYWHRD